MTSSNNQQEQLYSSYSSISETAMMSVWGRCPTRGYQQNVIPHILQMMNGNIPSEGIILMQGTGSGKSSVPQTVTLGSDQRSKIASANEYSCGKVLGIQLDELKCNKDQQN